MQLIDALSPFSLYLKARYSINQDKIICIFHLKNQKVCGLFVYLKLFHIAFAYNNLCIHIYYFSLHASHLHNNEIAKNMGAISLSPKYCNFHSTNTHFPPVFFHLISTTTLLSKTQLTERETNKRSKSHFLLCPFSWGKIYFLIFYVISLSNYFFSKTPVKFYSYFKYSPFKG